MANENLELLKFYRGEIKFESDLLAGRLNSFISSQSFLLIAYAGSMNGLISHWNRPFALLFPPVLALLALSLCIQARPGIRAAFEVIKEWQKLQDGLYTKCTDLHPYSLSLDAAYQRHRMQGSLFAKHAPQFFMVAWCYFLALPFSLFFFGGY